MLHRMDDWGCGDPGVIVPADLPFHPHGPGLHGLVLANPGVAWDHMSLARLWRRQLLGASSVALIVPSAMLAALVVLALGGGLSQVGVLGQIFAGPSLPATAPLGVTHAGLAGGARSLPVIPAAPVIVASRPSIAVRRALAVHSGGGASRTGGAIAPTGGRTAPPVTQGSGGSNGGSPPALAARLVASGSSPSGSSPQPAPPARTPQPSPAPEPQPRPTPVDTAVKVVTSVTQQVPAPVGTVVTQTVQAAGAAADGLLPQTGRPAPGASAPSGRRLGCRRSD